MTDGERIATLEANQEHGMRDHAAIFAAIEDVKGQIAGLETYLSANGGFTLTIKERRIKFAGSVPIPWSILALGSISSGGAGLGKLLGLW